MSLLLTNESGAVSATADVRLALTSGALALRQRAQRLADNPDAEAESVGIVALWFEEADLLDRLAWELHP